MNFIKVTFAGGTEGYLNADKVRSLYKDTHREYTTVETDGQFYYLSESPDEVLRMIYRESAK